MSHTSTPVLERSFDYFCEPVYKFNIGVYKDELPFGSRKEFVYMLMNGDICAFHEIVQLYVWQKGDKIRYTTHHSKDLMAIVVTVENVATVPDEIMSVMYNMEKLSTMLNRGYPMMSFLTCDIVDHFVMSLDGVRMETCVLDFPEHFLDTLVARLHTPPRTPRLSGWAHRLRHRSTPPMKTVRPSGYNNPYHKRARWW